MAVDVEKRQKQRRRLLLTGAFVCVFAVICTLVSLVGGWDSLYTFAGLRGDDAPAQTPTPTPDFTPELQVHLLDVDNADCVFVQSGEHTLLIDAGESKSSEEIIKYLKEQGVSRLDYVIATHPHADHIGGMAKVVQEFEIGTFLTSRLPDSQVPTTATYLRLLTALDERQVAFREITGTEEFSLGDATLSVWGPSGKHSDLNSYSLISRVTFKDKSFLFMGDAEEDEEVELLGSGFAVSADVLKIGHHGSRTSTSEAFLQKVSPSVALIPCGRDNSYGHPHSETLEKLTKAGVTTYRSDLCGHIVVTTDGASLTVSSAISSGEGAAA